MLIWQLGTSKELDLEQKLTWQKLRKAPKKWILTAAILLLNRWHRIPANEPFSGRSWGGPQEGFESSS